jgi:hypothetical protein
MEVENVHYSLYQWQENGRSILIMLKSSAQILVPEVD